MRIHLLDVAIGIMLALIAGRILGAEDVRGMVAAYVMMGATAAVVPIFFAALYLGFRKG